MMRCRDERGSVSVIIVFLAVAVLGVAGLGIDGGAGIAARQRATDLAEDAARAGAAAAAVPGPAGVVLDPSRATSEALDWLTAAGVDASNASIDVAEQLITVTVRFRHPTNLLRLAGVAHLDIEGSGTARPSLGITQEETG